MMEEENKQKPDNWNQGPLDELDDALLRIGRWIRLIAVIGFGIGAFVVIAMLSSGAQALRAIADALPIGGTTDAYPALVVVFFILFFIAALVLFYLYKAAQLLAQGVLLRDQSALSQAFIFLKYFFIVVIVFAAFQLAGNLFSLI